MKNKNILIISIIIFVGLLLGLFYYIQTMPEYGKKDILTNEILTSHEWRVEANGMYNYVVLKSDKTFEAFDYPEVVDSGDWLFEDGELVLNFNSGIERRTYSDFEFDKKGILNFITDNNEERWVLVD